MAERAGIRIFFIQAATPDGIASNDIDLNRNFPAENFDAGRDHGDEPLTEPESKILYNALNATAPVGVVSIHCCIPTFDLDGPAIGLAQSMQDAMSQRGQLFFDLEGLPSYGGSMGSYVSQIMERPIVAVEFQLGDELDVITQLYAMEYAIDGAVEWTAGQDPVLALDINALVAEDASPYSVFNIGKSLDGIQIRAELAGEGDKKVALVSGFDGPSRRSEFVAAHMRRRLLVNESSTHQTLIVNGINPDGLHQGNDENASGINVRLDLENQISPEAAAIRTALNNFEPETTIVFIDSERDAISAIGSEAQALMETSTDFTNPPADILWLQPLLDSNNTIIIVEVASDFGETQSSFDLELLSQSSLVDPIFRVLGIAP